MLVKKLCEKGYIPYVADDGSTDGTSAAAKSAGANVIRCEVNRGKGAALREGFERVLQDGFEMVVVMDGDGQHSVEDIGSLFETMEFTGSDLVVGNRMHDTASMPIIRTLTNHFMSFMISRICGQYVPDTQCGFRLIKREVLEKVRLESSRFEIESELIIKAARQGFKISSALVKTVYEDEKSRINPVVDTFRFVKFLAKLSREG
jgi:glycosyltransferase involved in cell wall biosynthesis